jgi:hypothetical protein
VAAPTGKRRKWSTPRRRSLACLGAALVVAGCGGGSNQKDAKSTPRQTKSPASGQTQTTPKKPNLHPASPQKVAIVRHWVDELRAGHVNKASTYFSVPVLVANASTPITLRTTHDVRLFNKSLPCGARVVRAVANGGPYTIVTFKLTERVGSPVGCGSGLGHLAATAFAFRHGKISQWIRVTVPSTESETGPEA